MRNDLYLESLAAHFSRANKIFIIFFRTFQSQVSMVIPLNIVAQNIFVVSFQAVWHWFNSNQLKYIIGSIQNLQLFTCTQANTQNRSHYSINEEPKPEQQERDEEKAIKVNCAYPPQCSLCTEMLTVWNLNAINGRTKSNHAVIFLPTSSGRITSNELPMLRTTISDLNPKKKEEQKIDEWKEKIAEKEKANIKINRNSKL